MTEKSTPYDPETLIVQTESLNERDAHWKEMKAQEEREQFFSDHDQRMYDLENFNAQSYV